jgi:membrane protein
MKHRLRHELQRTLWFAVTLRRRFAEDRCTRVAGSLSYTTLLALVPLTAVIFAVLSAFPVFQAVMDLLEEFIYTNFVPAAGEAVQKYVQQFAANAGRLTLWGLLFLFITALMLMATIERTFNDIWHVPQRSKRLHVFLSYWALLTLGPILIGLSLSITSYVVSLPLFDHDAMLGGFRAILLGSLPAAFEFLAFLLLYTVVPNHIVRLRYAIAGAAMAMMLFEIAKVGFGFFVVYFSSYRKIYGALAALPIFLIWIYVSWVVILLGAVATATLPEWKGGAGARARAAAGESVRDKLLGRRREVSGRRR